MATRTKVTFNATEGMFSFPLPYSGCLGPGQSAILADAPAVIETNLGGTKSQVVTMTVEPSTTALTTHASLPINLPVPTVSTNPASKAYVDSAVVTPGAAAGGALAGTYPNPTIASGATVTAPVITTGLTASGSASNNFGGSTGAFVTSSGAGTLSGTTNIAANKNVTCSAGTTALDLHLGTGATLTTTGLNTIGGDLLLAAGKILGFGAPQALSGAGAANVTTLATLITSTGSGDAITLADGTQAGQLKFLTMVVDGGSSVITPATKTDFTTLTLTAAYDWGLVIWSGSAWFPLAFGGTAAFA